MFTSKRPINAKKAKRSKGIEDGRPEFVAYARMARMEYEDLVNQKARATSEKKIAELDERIRNHMDISEIRAFLKFHIEPVISRNVSFGKINAKGEDVQYGFTCVVSKKGDSAIIAVSGEGSCFSNAKRMITSGALTREYRECSKRFIASETAHTKAKNAKVVADALQNALDVCDEMDGDGEDALLGALMLALPNMDLY